MQTFPSLALSKLKVADDRMTIEKQAGLIDKNLEISIFIEIIIFIFYIYFNYYLITSQYIIINIQAELMAIIIDKYRDNY